MAQLKPIIKKYLAKGNNREIFNNVCKKIAQSSESSIDVENDIIFNLPIEMEIYYFLKEIYQLALIGVFNFTACYKCFSIKNLGLTSTEHMHYLVPLQLKLYLNYKKIIDLQKCRWMDIKNIFTSEKAFVNNEKKREFKELCKNHSYFCSKLFSYFFRKIENNLEKLTNEDFVKMIGFFSEKKRDFEKQLIDYSLINSKHPKANKFLLNQRY